MGEGIVAAIVIDTLDRRAGGKEVMPKADVLVESVMVLLLAVTSRVREEEVWMAVEACICT